MGNRTPRSWDFSLCLVFERLLRNPPPGPFRVIFRRFWIIIDTKISKTVLFSLFLFILPLIGSDWCPTYSVSCHKGLPDWPAFHPLFYNLSQISICYPNIEDGQPLQKSSLTSLSWQQLALNQLRWAKHSIQLVRPQGPLLPIILSKTIRLL